MLTGDNSSTPEEHLSQCHYVHHKPHKDRSGIEPGPQTWIWRLTDCTLSRPQILEQNYTQYIHAVSKVLGPADTSFTTPRQTTPKILVTHDTDAVALHSVFWMTSQVMLQKRYTAPRYVTSDILFTNRWEWNRQDNNWFLYCINAMVRMSSTGCFQNGGLNMLDKFFLPVVPLLHSYEQPNFTQHGALPPFSFPVRACLAGQSGFWLVDWASRTNRIASAKTRY